LAGFGLPLSLFGLWLISTLIRATIRAHRRYTQFGDVMARTISANIQSTPLLPPPTDHETNGEHKLANQMELALDPEALEIVSVHDIHHSEYQVEMQYCCNGQVPIPSAELMLLNMALLSYSGLVKTASQLVQCRVSPIDNQKLVMFLAGKRYKII
jgi:hypothetical protein